MALKPQFRSVDQSACTWHTERRIKISQAHPEVKELGSHDPTMVLYILAIMALNLFCVIVSTRMDIVPLVILAATVGAFCRIQVFNQMHELCHNLVHPKLQGNLKTILMMLNQYPAMGTYFPYYRWFHLSHHAKLGLQSVEDAKKMAKSFGKVDGDILNTPQLFSIQRLTVDRTLTTPRWRALLLSRIIFYGLVAPVVRTLTGFILPTLLLVPDLIKSLRGWSTYKPEMRRSVIEAVVDRLLLIFSVFAVTWFLGWKGLLFVFLSAIFHRGFLFHPFLAFWVSVHKSHTTELGCQPTSTVYGRIWSKVCGGLNFHVEHHDFPSVPVRQLKHLKNIAPKFYLGIPHFSGPMHVMRDLIFRGQDKWVYGCQDSYLEKRVEGENEPAA